jgi:hypothetical protein
MRNLVSFVAVLAVAGSTHAQEYYVQVNRVQIRTKEEVFLSKSAFHVDKDEEYVLTTDNKKKSTRLSLLIKKTSDKEFVVEVSYTENETEACILPTVRHVCTQAKMTLNRTLILRGLPPDGHLAITISKSNDRK